MKKILTALIMLASMLTVPMFAAAPSSAAAKAYTVRNVAAVVYIEPAIDPIEYKFVANIEYKHYPTYDDITKVSYTVSKLRNQACNTWPPDGVQEFVVNLGEVGGWNIPSRSFACGNGEWQEWTKTVIPANGYKRVTHAIADRCLKMYVKVRKDNAPDLNRTSVNICLS